MVSIMSLWLPILLGAVFVFIVSSVIHMFLGYHSSDYKRLPNEEQVAAALRPFNIPPGNYTVPKSGSMKEMGTPEFKQKLNQGPVLMMTVLPNGPITMGKQFVQWFAFSALIGIFAAYMASRTLSAGAEYLAVFRVTGTVAFAGYGLAQIPESIWFARNWPATVKSVFDALIYAVLTGGVFGWLWPS